MTERIQKCAAQVADLLRTRSTVNILLLPELLQERSIVAYQALGWLAREGRLRYVLKGSQAYISLIEPPEGGHRADGA